MHAMRFDVMPQARVSREHPDHVLRDSCGDDVLSHAAHVRDMPGIGDASAQEVMHRRWVHTGVDISDRRDWNPSFFFVNMTYLLTSSSSLQAFDRKHRRDLQKGVGLVREKGVLIERHNRLPVRKEDAYPEGIVRFEFDGLITRAPQIQEL